MSGEITRLADKLILNPDTDDVSVQWTSQLTFGTAQWVGPVMAKFHIYRRPISDPLADWGAPFLIDQPLGVDIAIGDAATVRSYQYYLQVRMVQTNPAAPDPYDMSLLFSDQNGPLALDTSGAAYHFAGAVTKVREYDLILTAI